MSSVRNSGYSNIAHGIASRLRCSKGHGYDPANPDCQEKPLIGKDGKPNGFSRCPMLATVCRPEHEEKRRRRCSPDCPEEETSREICARCQDLPSWFFDKPSSR